MKTLGITALQAMAKPVIDKAAKVIEAGLDSLFGSKPEPKKKRIHDMTKLTMQQAIHVTSYHRSTLGTAEEHRQYLNKKFGLSKSKSFYAKIWNANTNTLNYPDGDSVK